MAEIDCVSVAVEIVNPFVSLSCLGNTSWAGQVWSVGMAQSTSVIIE